MRRHSPPLAAALIGLFVLTGPRLAMAEEKTERFDFHLTQTAVAEGESKGQKGGFNGELTVDYAFERTGRRLAIIIEQTVGRMKILEDGKVVRDRTIGMDASRHWVKEGTKLVEETPV